MSNLLFTLLTPEINHYCTYPQIIFTFSLSSSFFLTKLFFEWEKQAIFADKYVIYENWQYCSKLYI